MNILVAIIMGAGLLFFLGGTVGILRFPDVYTRLHAAGKLEVAGLLMTMVAIALYTVQDLTLASLLNGFKIILIVVFIFFTSPTATHAMIDAGFRAELEPWLKVRPTQEKT